MDHLSRHILVFGASGTIGRATVAELVARGHRVTCLLRRRADGQLAPGVGASLHGAELCFGEVTEGPTLADNLPAARSFDAVVSCLASRSGEPADAWAIDYRAQMNILSLARTLGIERMVLLSAICVQKPRLAFQFAKLKFEQALAGSGLAYSIVRPTAYFKSLSGQLGRLQRGKPFLVFGDGRLTACKPISDADLAVFIADCLQDPARHNKILPIGGPGSAITPLQQGEYLFDLLGRKPRFQRVPVSMLSGAATVLGGLGKLAPRLAAKAELARIGHYYATESMLLLDPATGHYDAAATPETGRDTLYEFYRRVIAGQETVERGDHAVF